MPCLYKTFIVVSTLKKTLYIMVNNSTVKLIPGILTIDRVQDISKYSFNSFDKSSW